MMWDSSPRISQGDHETVETLSAERLSVVISGFDRFALREGEEAIGLLTFVRLVESRVEQAGELQ
jgi:hypothetical protein